MYNVVYVINIAYICVLLISKYLKIMFTITKSTQSGIHEVLTEKWLSKPRSCKTGPVRKTMVHERRGDKKVLELRKLCRLTSIKNQLF